MDTLTQTFPVNFSYQVHFTENLFALNNPLLVSVIKNKQQDAAKTIVITESNLAEATHLIPQILAYANYYADAINLCAVPLQLAGGEAIKNDNQHLQAIYQLIHESALCRHSYVIAIGGGALLDMVGYAAATAHRGIRLIRVPTTVLAQADSGVGVKNAINYFDKKNFLGTFAPPYAVLNDFNFLRTLSVRDWRAGIAEAVKVALIKDCAFFAFIQQHAQALQNVHNMQFMKQLIYRCAQLHMQHIGTAGDPFEMGSSRPLDFGHWSAHKLESLTHHRLRHGEAVAIGIALDSTYSYLSGLLPEADWQQIIHVLHALGFELYVPELSRYSENAQHPLSLFRGLTEFQEHLGGELTIMLLQSIGQGVEVHRVDLAVYLQAISYLEKQTINSHSSALAVAV